MTDGWFDGLDTGDVPAAAEQIREGRADAVADWPARAVETGFAADEAEYYDMLHTAATTATREAVRTAERADDRQLIHAVRAVDE